MSDEYFWRKKSKTDLSLPALNEEFEIPNLLNPESPDII
jgi:hypothetical protein